MIIIQLISEFLVVGEFPTAINEDSYHLLESFEIAETESNNIKIFEIEDRLYLNDTAKLALYVLEILDSLILYETVSFPTDLYLADHLDLTDSTRTVLYQLVEEILLLIEILFDSKGYTETITLQDTVTFSMTRNLEIEDELNFVEGALGYILDSGYSTCEE